MSFTDPHWCGGSQTQSFSTPEPSCWVKTNKENNKQINEILLHLPKFSVVCNRELIGFTIKGIFFFKESNLTICLQVYSTQTSFCDDHSDFNILGFWIKMLSNRSSVVPHLRKWHCAWIFLIKTQKNVSRLYYFILYFLGKIRICLLYPIVHEFLYICLPKFHTK